MALSAVFSPGGASSVCAFKETQERMSEKMKGIPKKGDNLENFIVI